MAAITNYHKLSDFGQHNFIILQFYRSEVQSRSHWAKTKVLAGLCFFLEALGENLFPCFFQLVARPLTLLGS